jgi:kinase
MVASSALDWPTRYKIMMDVANGLSYLHHDCNPPILHRDIKLNNILLGADFTAKIADFGLAKTINYERTNSTCNIVGSCGYIAPGKF